MIDSLRTYLSDIHPLLVPITGLSVLLALAWLSNALARHQIIRLLHRAAKKTETRWDDLVIEHGVVGHATKVLPATVVYFGIPLVPELSTFTIGIVQSVTRAVLVLIVVLAVNAVLSAVNAIYEERQDARKRPIKGYVQVTKLLVFCIGTILIISVLLDKSPLLWLSGFGALTAILLLVFRDTILSLVASVQLSSLDMVRVGDWIEMPHFNADGSVIDIALHTIRVQNWDKTITTIPTHKLITDSFRNWRGMSESGGRRIKRSLLFDMASVRFLSTSEADRFRDFALLTDYIETKLKELNDYNANLVSESPSPVNLRKLTNLGTFRAYIHNYLQNHPRIHKDMTLMVRQLAPRPEGIPIEIYCFTNTTVWSEYEGIQSDIFDHLLAVLGEFGLRAYQQPSGADLAGLGSVEQVDAQANRAG